RKMKSRSQDEPVRNDKGKKQQSQNVGDGPDMGGHVVQLALEISRFHIRIEKLTRHMRNPPGSDFFTVLRHMGNSCARVDTAYPVIHGAMHTIRMNCNRPNKEIHGEKMTKL